MKTVRVWSAAVAVAVLGCGGSLSNNPPARPITSETLMFSGDRDVAFSAALRALTNAGFALGAADRPSGILTTEWKQTFVSDVGWNILAGMDVTAVRRVRFSMVIDRGVVVITPNVEVCQRGACEATAGFPNEERRLAENLVAHVRDELKRSDGVALVEASAFYDTAAPMQTGAMSMESQTGQVVVQLPSGAKELRLQEPIELVFKNGAHDKGVLDAASPEVVQIRSGGSTRRYLRSDLVGAMQF